MLTETNIPCTSLRESRVMKECISMIFAHCCAAKLHSPTPEILSIRVFGEVHLECFVPQLHHSPVHPECAIRNYVPE